MVKIGINDAARRERIGREINAERDRRILETFVFEGHRYQLDQHSKQNITGAGALAGFALGKGAQRRNYRWHGGNQDFSWLTADNEVVTMDAETVFAFAQAAAEQVRRHIFIARRLKDMPVIPEDFTNDRHWQEI